MNLKNEYYMDENGEEKYHELCIDCDKKCKQSYKVNIIFCPKKKKGGKK